VGNYDELDTARLTWVVLDRLVPPDDEPAARKALIARDPKLRSLVLQGALSEDEAIDALRARDGRYGGRGRSPLVGHLARWSKAVAVLAGAAAVVTVLAHLAH
jgi:hypothetical protein